jgi:hypothetical protein
LLVISLVCIAIVVLLMSFSGTPEA